MLTIVALASLLYLLFGAATAIRRSRRGPAAWAAPSVSREWLLHYQNNERPAHY